MDSFMDKIVQKLSTQDIIRANAEAEAAEKESLRKQVDLMQKQMEQYDACIQEMRKLNLRNTESAEIFRNLALNAGEDTSDKINMAVEAATELSTARINHIANLSEEKISQTAGISEDKIVQMIERSEEKINQVVSATEEKVNHVVNDCILKITEIQAGEQEKDELVGKLEELKELISNNKSAIEESFKNSDEFVHKENVKVYRNIQAVMMEAFEKQTTELSVQVGKSGKGSLPVGIISLILGGVNLLVLLAYIFKLI